MPCYAYKAKLSYKENVLKTVEGTFKTDQYGTSALDALVASLKSQHQIDGKILQVGVECMYMLSPA